ncbi:hypothetical protein LCGC14_1208090 [marine sediment metagenome]|uniref:Uncharacterized protein n=1 Tax=marine sediment metagenome TaxID=412755 RepID=A0A0F9LJ95_9ZZZZ
MSHSVDITLIADQEIRICGKAVNIHSIKSIEVNYTGQITDAFVKQDGEWLSEAKENNEDKDTG